MEQVTPLKAWMDVKGYSNSELAKVMGLSYEYIYKLASGDVNLSHSFKWRFLECFGREEANKIFDADPQPAVVFEAI